MSLDDQQQEERTLADAAVRAEARSYALGMAAAVKSLTCSQPATAREVADVQAAEAEVRATHEALQDCRRRARRDASPGQVPTMR